jgi:hypothetical protein
MGAIEASGDALSDLVPRRAHLQARPGRGVGGGLTDPDSSVLGSGRGGHTAQGPFRCLPVDARETL